MWGLRVRLCVSAFVCAYICACLLQLQLERGETLISCKWNEDALKYLLSMSKYDTVQLCALLFGFSAFLFFVVLFCVHVRVTRPLHCKHQWEHIIGIQQTQVQRSIRMRRSRLIAISKILCDGKLKCYNKVRFCLRECTPNKYN